MEGVGLTNGMSVDLVITKKITYSSWEAIVAETSNVFRACAAA